VRDFLLVIAALLIQSTFTETIAIRQIKPDVVLVVLVFISLSDGQIAGTAFGFLAGWLQDIYSPQHLGLNALCKSITGFLVGYGHGGVIEKNVITQSAILFVATILHDVMYFVVYCWGHMQDYMWYLVRHSIPTAFYTSAVGLLFLLIHSAWRMRKGHYARRFVSR